MNRNRLQISDKNIITTFVICMIMGILVFMPYIIKEGGVLTLCDDYNTQMIPFVTSLNNSLKAGNGSWEWNIGLGAQRLGGYSYYYLGSAFFWITMLFPGDWFPYIVGPMYILKYAVCGMIAYIYLKRYCNNKLCAIAGAIVYAFSGFQSVNLEFYMFHDVVAFFPLLLMGTEELYDNNKKELFVFAVALNCALNYFFFYGEVVFLIIYVLFRYRKAQGKEAFWNKTWECIRLGILGMGLAAIIFIPSAIYTFGNPRVLPDVIKMLHKKTDWLGVLKGFLLPADAMNSCTIVSEWNWKSVNCYLPMIGMSLTIPYVVKKRDWLSNILIFCFVISFIPVVVSLFYLFTQVYYRWWYMYILLMLVAVVKVLDNREDYPIRSVAIVYFIVTTIFAGMFWIGELLGSSLLDVYRPQRYLLLCLIAEMGCICTVFLSFQKKNVLFKYIFGVAIFGVLSTSATVELYKLTTREPEYMTYWNAGKSLPANDEQYRYATNDNMLIYPGKANGTGTFSSTSSNATRELEDLLGYFSISENVEPKDYPGLTEFLAGRYEVISDDMCYNNYSIKEREVSPIGYYYNSFITQDELLELSAKERGLALLKDLVIKDKYVDDISVIIKHDDAYLEVSEQAISEYVSNNRKNAVLNFSRIHSGFTCQTDSKKDSCYFFSVPDDWGWRVYIDGKKSKIINASGFMAVVVPEGNHELVFKFRSPGLILGIICSLISLSIVICYYIKKRKQRI